MIDRIHTYDLDGVLVDTSHRYRNLDNGAIDLDYWMKNKTVEKIAQDKLLPLSKQYQADCVNPSIYTIICTARVQDILDIDFIFYRLGMPDKLIMRPVNNQERDAVLKRKQLQRLFNLRQFQNKPRKLWEDNKRNIEALRHLFTDCFHIPSHITRS